MVEWEAEMQYWSQENRDGAFASPLKLTVGGYRGNGSGSISQASYGYYWSQDISSGAGFTRMLMITGTEAKEQSYSRGCGISVRCVLD